MLNKATTHTSLRPEDLVTTPVFIQSIVVPHPRSSTSAERRLRRALRLSNTYNRVATGWKIGLW